VVVICASLALASLLTLATAGPRPCDAQSSAPASRADAVRGTKPTNQGEQMSGPEVALSTLKMLADLAASLRAHETMARALGGAYGRGFADGVAAVAGGIEEYLQGVRDRIDAGK
jgi:hypothetical protein